MELMVITRPDFFEGESEAIRMLLDEGLEFLHIRKPGSTPEQVEQLLKQIPGKYYNRIVLHEHVDLALRYELRGFHVNRRTTEHVPYYKWEVSTSVHSLEELKKKKGSYEYLFLSPVFDSISKTGYHSAFTPGQLRQAREHFVLDYGIIALGGVTADRVGMLRMLGFGGVAVLGDVWDHFGQPDFLEHFRQLLRATNTPPVVLTVAGSDSSGGAGIQADIKTLSGLSAYAASVITAVTAQNTLGVQDVFPVPAPVVRQQLESVLVDLPVAAIKIGMVPNASVAQTLAEVLSAYPHLPVVCDPVMVSTSGRSLMEPETIRAMEESVFPRCTLLTPNLPEASLLLGHSIDDVEAMKEACEKNGVELITASVSNSSEVKMAAESIIDRVDAMYEATDNTVISAIAAVSEVCMDNSVPLFSADVTSSFDTDVLIAGGFDYYASGKLTGEVIRRMLNGEEAKDIGTLYLEDLEILVNLDVATRLGIQIPDDIMQRARYVIENGETNEL